MASWYLSRNEMEPLAVLMLNNSRRTTGDAVALYIPKGIA